MVQEKSKTTLKNRLHRDSGARGLPFLKIKNKFRSRLLIRFNGKSLIQKKSQRS